jgi:hypothetical protein
MNGAGLMWNVTPGVKGPSIGRIRHGLIAHHPISILGHRVRHIFPERPFNSPVLLHTHSQSLGTREQIDRFLCGHNGTGIMWKIGDQGGVHELLSVIRGRILYQRGVVPKLSGKAHR